MNSKFNSATALTIGGIKVKFPVKPYPSQLSMMNMIMKGLNKGQHCLLESPTGSGKSLALLCSALAWQQMQKEQQLEQEYEPVEDNEPVIHTCITEQPKDDSPSTSKYFTKGCIDEDDDDDFKDTPKRSKDKVLRESHPTVSKAENCAACQCSSKTAKEEALDDKQNNTKTTRRVKIPKIWFGTRTHKQISQITKEMGRTEYKNTNMTILSSRQHSCINEVVMKSSNKNEACRDMRKGVNADLLGVKCAFYQNVNRLSNHKQLYCAGLSSAWDLEDLVQLGKNVKACPYYCSKELVSSADIVFCPYNYLIDPLIRGQMQINLSGQILILDEAHNIEDSARNAGSFSLSEHALANTTSDLEFLISDEIKVDDHRPLHLLCTRLGQWIHSHASNLKEANYESYSLVWTGRDVVRHLEEWGITQDTLPLLERNYAQAIETDEIDPENPTPMLHSISQATFSGLFTVLRYLMDGEYKNAEDYRITVVKESTYGVVPPTRTRDGWVKINKRPKKYFVTTLHFWCMNPAVAFGDLTKSHCIILTSGTLSPMSSFSSELGVSFPIQLEANHVINDTQVWIGSIGQGLNNVNLQATYQNTETYPFQDELGSVISKVCQIVPYGVLCFFSSYKMLEKLRDRWQDTGKWQEIERLKVIVCEPRGGNKEQFEILLQQFYGAITEHANGSANHTGALLLAVCRGKVSEGLDFADNNARAVITVGIPFPYIKDKQVELKRRYNDIHRYQKGLLSGSQWYEIQAYRAMNQALGRCIRHKEDWGALIIIDDRFCKNPKKYCQGLSKWVRQKVQLYRSCSVAMESLGKFVNNQTADPTNKPDLAEGQQQCTSHVKQGRYGSRDLLIPSTLSSTNTLQTQKDTLKLPHSYGEMPQTSKSNRYHSKIPDYFQNSASTTKNEKHNETIDLMNELEEDLIIGDSNDSFLHDNNTYDTIVIPESPDKLEVELPKSKSFGEPSSTMNFRKRKLIQTSPTDNQSQNKRAEEKINVECLNESEEFPARQRNRKSKQIKNQDGEDIHCKSCSSSLLARNCSMATRYINSPYLGEMLSTDKENTGGTPSISCIWTKQSEIQKTLGCVPHQHETDSGILLNSFWCEKEQRCFKFYECGECSTIVACSIVSNSQNEILFFQARVLCS